MYLFLSSTFNQDQKKTKDSFDIFLSLSSVLQEGFKGSNFLLLKDLLLKIKQRPYCCKYFIKVIK
jgi:hypothetical protein